MTWLGHQLWLPGLDPVSDWVFWTLAKVALWFLPAALWLRGAGVGLAEGFGWTWPSRRDLLLGLWYCTLWLALSEGQRLAGTARPVALELSLGHFSAVLVAPVLEEALFRGFLHGRLRAMGLGMGACIGVASLLFAAMHLPGWLAVDRFQGITLYRELGMLALCGLVFGLARERGGLIGTAIPLHSVNNLWSSGVFGWMLSWI